MNRLTLLVVVLLVLLAALLMTSCAPGPTSAVVGGMIVLLHGFVKKSQKTPATDLKTARQRLADLREE